MNRLRGEFRPSGVDHYNLDDRSFSMESDLYNRLDLSYLPVHKERRGSRLLMIVGGLVAIALIFQMFFRYDYVSSGRTVLRIDRLTHQVCQITGGRIDCAVGRTGPSLSTSTSTSTSLSTSSR